MLLPKLAYYDYKICRVTTLKQLSAASLMLHISAKKHTNTLKGIFLLRTNWMDMLEAWTNSSYRKNVKSNSEKQHFCLGKINGKKKQKKLDTVVKRAKKFRNRLIPNFKKRRRIPLGDLVAYHES